MTRDGAYASRAHTWHRPYQLSTTLLRLTDSATARQTGEGLEGIKEPGMRASRDQASPSSSEPCV